MYSLIVTAKLNDIDPQAWLADVLARIAGHPASRLDELLPWNWRSLTPSVGRPDNRRNCGAHRMNTGDMRSDDELSTAGRIASGLLPIAVLRPLPCCL